MARSDFKSRSGGGSAGRPPLEPENPLPLATALMQVVLLLGIPIGLLLLMKVVMRTFFPSLGY